MNDTALAVQKAYYQRLDGLVSGVEAYDNVPESAGSEYIFISSDTAVDDSTKTEYGQEVTQEIQVITHEGGSKARCREIVGQIVESIITDELEVEGFYHRARTMLDMRQVFDGDYTETGQITRGIIRFRHKLQQT
jgi:hypothetical protein